MFDAATLKCFEDLLEGDSETNLPQSEEENFDDNLTVINKLDANSLTLKDLLHEMEMRNLQPRGFFEDDAKLLQEQLDKEHEEYLESKQREKQEARELEASQAMVRRRKALQEVELREERQEIQSDKRIDEWFRLVKKGFSPLICRVDVNNISARTLARLLWSDCRIISIDVSTMNLSDYSGAYLARALKNNKSIKKLEMNENYLGSKTCTTLANALCCNNTIKYLSIESNPLTAKNGTCSIEALVKIIRDNKSLQHLSLWRCNIGIEGGRDISEALLLNENLTCFELGYNFWDFTDIQRIQDVLAKNRSIQRQEKVKRIVLRKEEEERIRQQKKVMDEKRKEEMDLLYIENQKLQRSEIWRQEMEALDDETQRQEEQRRQDEELKLLEQEHLKKSKKSKKKKKKKKK